MKLERVFSFFLSASAHLFNGLADKELKDAQHGALKAAFKAVVRECRWTAQLTEREVDQIITELFNPDLNNVAHPDLWFELSNGRLLILGKLVNQETMGKVAFEQLLATMELDAAKILEENLTEITDKWKKPWELGGEPSGTSQTSSPAPPTPIKISTESGNKTFSYETTVQDICSDVVYWMLKALWPLIFFHPFPEDRAKKTVEFKMDEPKSYSVHTEGLFNNPKFRAVWCVPIEAHIKKGSPESEVSFCIS